MGLLCVTDAWAQDGADAAAQANNPLANLTAVNVQHYYIPDLTGLDDESASQYWLRYARPFSLGDSSVLLRASLPYLDVPSATGGREQGLGDFNVFAAYLFDTGNPAISFGLGPQVTFPSATEDALGSEQWSAGAANVLFNANSPKVQYGYLLTWQASFAGEDDRVDVNVGALQPFAFYQLGGGNYLRAAPVWLYNFENDDYSVPLGVGFGKVIKQGKTVYNVFLEPQYSVADDGVGQPEWQMYMALNMQFY